VAEKNPLLDRREFVFGTVRPGEKRSWAVPVKIPKGTDSRRDQVTLHFDDDAGKAPAEVATSFGVVEVQKPAFAFTVQLDDRAGGNGDGLAQRGESFTVRVDVKNVGEGTSGDKTFITLKNLGDEKMFIKKGRDVLGTIKPGESKSAAMEVELRRGSRSEELPFRVQIIDEKMDQFVTEKIDWPISNDERAPSPAKMSLRVEAAEALLRTGAAPSAWVLATAKRGATLQADARVGDFWRVEWQKGRFAFVADADVKPTKALQRSGVVAEAWQREPPRISITPDPIKGAPVVEGESFKLSGSATVSPRADGTARLRDVFVFVNEQKVFFKVVPQSAAADKLDFQADLPLQNGNNVVSVFAREDEELQTRRTLVIYRRPPAEVAQDAARAKQQAQ
jgi:carboxyl-terminal processing protease